MMPALLLALAGCAPRYAGLGAGPEARIASGITDKALGGGGCETSDYAVRSQIREWLLRNVRRGRL